MQPLLNPGFAYDKPKIFTYQILTPGDTKYSAVPFRGKPPSPPPPENAELPSELVNKAEEGTQDSEKGGEPAASNDETPESTCLLSLLLLELTFAKSILH